MSKGMCILFYWPVFVSTGHAHEAWGYLSVTNHKRKQVGMQDTECEGK